MANNQRDASQTTGTAEPRSKVTRDEFARSGMRRTRAQWSNMEPKAVVAGSEAQIVYCIEDARSDILSLYAEIDQLRWELRGPKP